MAKVKVRVLKRHGKFMPGETAEISQRDLKPMLRMGRVALIVEAPAKPLRTALAAAPVAAQSAARAAARTEPQAVAAQTTTRTGYMRADVTETQPPTVDQLRAKYRRKFREDPDNRWGIPRLTQALESGKAR